MTSSPTTLAVFERFGILSPSPSPPFQSIPVIATDDQGMVVEDGLQTDGPSHVRAVKRPRAPRKKRQPKTYVSKHFPERALNEPPTKGEIPCNNHVVEPLRSLVATPIELLQASLSVGRDAPIHNHVLEPLRPLVATPYELLKTPRIFYGLNVDELSSDSSLTDVPEYIGPDPFATKSSAAGIGEVQAVKVKSNPRKHPTTSPYFPLAHRPRPHFLSTLPFPPLTAPKFGLMQERLAHDPFRLLIATIFLNKTPGERAMPVFYELMEEYPTPKDLANADVADVTAIIHHLGFQNQRARKCVAMAKAWVERPPEYGKRYRKLNYPTKGDGRDMKQDEAIDDDDERVGWEISHLPGVGPYSHDSWRMFCRDCLRGVASSWQGEDAESERFEPEWKRVVATDKELRAYLTWMWLKEGWIWNKETGHRTKAPPELMEMAMGGGIVVEEKEKDILTIQPVQQDVVVDQKTKGKVEKPAGEFLDSAIQKV